MDSSPIPGFITRKQASERCKRAERTLQRYWSRAIELRTTDVLDHLKLSTEDGQIVDGLDVTKDAIERLKNDGKNPTWYVHAAWVQKTYGPRPDVESRTEEPKAKQGTTEKQPEPSPNNDVTELLKQQISQLREDKQELREELKIKNEQISQASERDRETHLLMRDLHGLLHDMQQRLPAPAVSKQPLSNADAGDRPVDSVHDAEIVERKSEEGTGRKRKAKPPKTKTPRSPNKRSRKQRSPSAFEKHTPTFHRALSKLFHRS